MSRIRTMAYAAALVLGIGGLAGAQTPATAGRAAAADSARGARMDSARSRRPARPAMQARVAQTARARRMGDMASLRGVQLTDAQRTQMQQLRERYRTRTTELLRSSQPDRAAMEAAAQRRKALRDSAMVLRQEEIAAMRAILTPEQQKQFDANRKNVMERSRDRRESEVRNRRPAPERRVRPATGGGARTPA